VYASNEEAVSRHDLRFTQAILGRTKSEIASDISKASSDRVSSGYERIKFVDKVSSVSQVGRLLDELRPRILYIDQGTKVSIEGGDESNEVFRLQRLFNWYREKAKEYDCTIISLAQASGEAENKKWLRLTDLFGSKVTIQGELDFAIGVGRVLDNVAYSRIRFISVCKNKLADGESLRMETLFENETCTFREV
jgi:hypothetical protein